MNTKLVNWEQENYKHRRTTGLDNSWASRLAGYGWRIMERMIAVILLACFLPLILVMAILIKIDTPGPIIFRQTRLGLQGKPFTLYKLRTMYQGNEPIFAAYLESHPEINEEWLKYAKLRGYDPRLTRVGRCLRRLSLNELPQFVNVIRGQMSLIGPRPYLPAELSQMSKQAEVILSVRPGVTGLWQVSGRNNIPFPQRVEMDVWYVQNRNWHLDLIILLRTIPAVLFQWGAS